MHLQAEMSAGESLREKKIPEEAWGDRMWISKNASWAVWKLRDNTSSRAGGRTIGSLYYPGVVEQILEGRKKTLGVMLGHSLGQEKFPAEQLTGLS